MYDYPETIFTNGESYALFAGILVIVLIVTAIIVLPFYILGSIGLMRLAQNKGIENAWLAWIPFASLYILGKVVDNFDIGDKNINKLELVLPLSVLASGAISMIPFIGWIFSIAILLLNIFTNIKLFKMYAPSNYVLYTVLSVIGLGGIMMFVIRNNTPIEVPAIGKPIFS